MFCKICSNNLKLALKTNQVHQFTRLYQTHYEVLNLPRTCTSKQIKSAYIKLSKEHHPDVNRSTQSHVKFQQISEAYKVLGKPETRRSYDLGLAEPARQPYTRMRPGHNPYADPQFWANRDRSRDEYYENKAYYGIDGIPRLSNGTIMVICVFFAMVGLGLQYLAVTRSFTFQREELIRKSMAAERALYDTREAAKANGNTAQLEALKTRLLSNESDTKKCD